MHKIFAEGRTNYAGEPIGVIVAESPEIARKAIDAIKVEYLFRKKGNFDVRQIIKIRDKKRVKEFPKNLEPKTRGSKYMQ